jgi:transposase-like protein
MSYPLKQFADWAPEVIAIAKQLLIDLVAGGKTLTAARDAMGLTQHTVHVWRRDDPEFLAALNAAAAERGETRGKPPMPESEVEYAKAELLRLVAETGTTVKDALQLLGITRDRLRRWRKDDPAYDQRFREAVEDLTEHEADRLKDIHTEIPDPKVAKVASDNLQWWLEQRNPRMRPRAPLDEGNVQLTDILRSAVTRLIEMTAPPQQAPVLDVKVEPVNRIRFSSGPPEEGT